MCLKIELKRCDDFSFGTQTDKIKSSCSSGSFSWFCSVDRKLKKTKSWIFALELWFSEVHLVLFYFPFMVLWWNSFLCFDEISSSNCWSRAKKLFFAHLYLKFFLEKILLPHAVEPTLRAFKTLKVCLHSLYLSLLNLFRQRNWFSLFMFFTPYLQHQQLPTFHLIDLNLCSNQAKKQDLSCYRIYFDFPQDKPSNLIQLIQPDWIFWKAWMIYFSTLWFLVGSINQFPPRSSK